MAYTAISIEGGLFPADLLDEIATGGGAGQREQDFGLPAGVRLSDEIQLAFSEIRKHWDSFRARLARSAASPTTLTREHWIIPMFETLGVLLQFQRAAQQVGTDTFVISHLAGTEPGAPPVHVVALDQSLDRRAEGNRRSPHATVQEYLNRSDAVWGIVTNGDHLRLLRDAQALARPAYIQFDLRAMVEGNLYSEFVLLFRLLHHTRWTERPTETVSLLERYYQEGIDIGGRVREHLRDGVEEALRRLGTAFVSHPESQRLRDAIDSGQLDATEYYRELLRLIYRFLFLLVVEERKLLLSEDSGENAGESLARGEIYTRFYSMARLRDRCERRFEDDGYADLWDGMKQSFLLFREQERASALGLAALNGELFGPEACAHIEEAYCSNVDLLRAIFHISTFQEKRGRRRVNYAALDVEELGSVYESLLEFHPLVELQPKPRFDLVTGSERKQTGSYYTPPSLVAELISSALLPVMTERLREADTWQAKEAALLGLRVVDPASGSGHFLLAAARAIARELARVRNEGNEPSPVGYRKALRDVVRSCIYAVDRNPLAVDLCKVALWIEGYNAGMPLSFLDNHIKQGDSLVGVFDLNVLEEGIPDEAYAPVSGDDKKVAASVKKFNRAVRAKQVRIGDAGWLPGEQMTLFSTPPIDIEPMADRFRELGVAEERTPYEVHQKAEKYERLRTRGSEWYDLKVACDLWTAAFFLPLQTDDSLEHPVPTTDSVRTFLAQPGAGHGALIGKAAASAKRVPFFHWPLEFPDVLAGGGFDVVLGNPPWERIKLQEQEFFGARDPEIARAPNKVARERLIKTLAERSPQLNDEFRAAVRASEAASKFIRGSGRFPLCGRGDVNTYSIFAELNRGLVGTGGRAGCIVPSGIATDDTTKWFFGDLMGRRSLASLYDIENREGIFPGVGHGRFKFCLLTMTAPGGVKGAAEFAFFLTNTKQLEDAERRFSLTSEDMALLNPNTRTCPIFRTRRDAEITKAIYRRVPVLIREGEPEENPWGISLMAMFHMSNDSGLFRTREELEAEGWRLEGNIFERDGQRYLPLYEAKFLWHFDHRLGSYEGFVDRPENSHLPPLSPAQHSDPRHLVQPWYWAPEGEVSTRLAQRWDRDWLLGWRDICRSTDERTVIASMFPRVGVGNNEPLVLLAPETVSDGWLLACCLSSLVLDFCARFKVGGTHLNFFIANQLPVLEPSRYHSTCPWSIRQSIADWMACRSLELTYTAWDMAPFARDMGYNGPPFPWDEERRFHLRCELDAAFFHLYGIELHDVEYIMDTFPIVKRKDEARWGEYRTKRVILEIYDAMKGAMEMGIAYEGSVDRSALMTPIASTM